MKTAILYHQVKPGIDCPDGIVSAWIASKIYPNAIIMGCCYQEEIDLEEFDQIILVDFSLPRKAISELLERKKITIIDHHLTAFNDLSNLELRGLIDISGEYCGATLTWKYYFPELAQPIFLKYIQDRDNWDFRFPETQFIHEAFSKLRSLCPEIASKFALFDALSKLDYEGLTNWLVPIGRKLLEPKLEAVYNAFVRWEEYQLGEYKIALIRLKPEEERLTSDICMKMYQDEVIAENYPFVACLMSDKKTFSLRSNKWGNNFDVAKIAEQYGGGGHRNAAGFKLES